MSLRTKVCFVVLGSLFAFILDINECRKLDGYKFPVYSTSFCPRDESEWNNRSLALSCNKTNGYTCLPNEKFTELLEFCYTAPFIWIQEGVCLYLERKGSNLYAYNCRQFIDGCHNTSYQSRRIFEYPACISIGNGCFLAEQSCKRIPTTYLRETTEYTKTENDPKINKTDLEWIVPLAIGVVLLFIGVTICMLIIFRRRRKFTSFCKTKSKEKGHEECHEENKPFINQEVEKNVVRCEQEFTSICETKSYKESHEENKPCIHEDVEKNVVRREQEFTSICETKSHEEIHEESHEENKPFINEDVEKNAVRREQEFSSICEKKSDEECHEENKPCINEDVEKNAVRREQGNVTVGDSCSFNWQCTGNEFSGLYISRVRTCQTGYILFDNNWYPGNLSLYQLCVTNNQCSASKNNGYHSRQQQDQTIATILGTLFVGVLLGAIITTIITKRVRNTSSPNGREQSIEMFASNDMYGSPGAVAYASSQNI